MIRLDTSLQSHDELGAIPDLAATIDSAGFDGIWTAEVNHDPFLQLALAGSKTENIALGTAIALSFTRSPMALAYTSWDLAALTQGRFILGLGTQVKAHNEKRFSVPWSSPIPRLREVIEGLRAIWRSWRTGERLNYRGDHYKFTLMTPFFTPPTHEYGVPIYIAGVNRRLCTLAGELGDGFHVHPLHSTLYLRDYVIPHIAAGAESAGRAISELGLSASVFVVTGENDEQMDRMREEVRAQISFYASTPTYRTIFEMHGWADTAEALSRLAARKQWEEMPALITDDIVEALSISGAPETIGEQAIERYTGLLDRVTLYMPYVPGQLTSMWDAALRAFAAQKD